MTGGRWVGPLVVGGGFFGAPSARFAGTSPREGEDSGWPLWFVGGGFGWAPSARFAGTSPCEGEDSGWAPVGCGWGLFGAPSARFAGTSPREGEDSGWAPSSREGEDIVVFTVLPLQGEVARRAGGGPCRGDPPGLRGPGETACGLAGPGATQARPVPNDAQARSANRARSSPRTMSTSSVEMSKLGVKRRALVPPWMTPMPRRRACSSTQPAPTTG